MATTLTKTVREYIDVDFSFTKHPLTKNVSIKKQVNAVKQSIKHLLFLKSGDKPFHPEIKSPINDFLFENASTALKVVMESEVIRYLGVYEPRAQITDVNVYFPDPNSIVCAIEGMIINLSEPFSVSILVARLR